jgi:outer membrane protein OmpA-like peptidoglycan-associated protein
MNSGTLHRLFLFGFFTIAVAGCTGPNGLNVPAGSAIDEGGFGDPTARNNLVMTGRIATEHLDRRFAASVPTTINFAFDSAELSQDARSVLDRQAHFMLQFPELRFSVYGHTDLVGSDAYNEGLGRRRATAMVRYLVGRGVDISRLDALVSFGEQRPLVPTPSSERANRRTVTRVAGFQQDNRLVLDGKYGQIVYRNYVGTAGPGNTISAVEE